MNKFINHKCGCITIRYKGKLAFYEICKNHLKDGGLLEVMNEHEAKEHSDD